MKLLKAFRLFWVENGLLRCSLTPTFFGGGGGPSQTTSTVTQSSIPDWLQPQTQAMLGAATQQIFNTNGSDITGIKGFNPYSANPADYVAPFSPLQQQSYANVAGLQTPSQYNVASDITANAGMGALGTTGTALGYGAQGAGYGAQGAQYGLGAAQNLGGQASYYGGQGAGYGGAAANLAGQGLGYGAQGAGYGAQGVGIGQQATGLTGQTLGYGQTAADIGQAGAAGAAGLGSNVANQAMGYGAQAAQSGDIYGQMATNPNAIQSYMSPYQQNVTDVAKAAALRDFQVGQTMRQGNATRSGAFGGARQAIENAEAQRNLNTQLQGIEAQGLQSAYQNAQQAQQFQAQQRLQGLQGAQQGLGTALNAGQLGLSGAGQAIQGQQAALQGVGQAANLYNVGLQGTAQGMQGAQAGLAGLNAANQAYQTGIQGANLGLSGVNQGISAGQLGLAGTAQGITGANAGLAGIQQAQAGYGQATQAGSSLANIGTANLAAQQNIIGAQNQYGQQQTQQQQDIINNAIQNYASAQQYPMQQLAMYNALLRGYATPTSAQTVYQTPPSALSQFGGLAATGLGAYMASKKEGGKIEEPKTYKSGGLVDLAIANAMEDK